MIQEIPIANHNQSDYNINCLIFAKVKGFPAWPAKIINIDKETYKNVIKYEVYLFGSQETAFVKAIDICPYNVNKFKYTMDKTAKKHHDIYKLGLSEIEKAWKFETKLTSSLKNKNNSLECVTPRSSSKFLSNEQKLLSATKSPRTDLFLNVENHSSNNSVKSQDKSKTMSDKSVNTPDYMDLNFKLNALTDRCIDLEKSLIEKSDNACTNNEGKLTKMSNSSDVSKKNSSSQTDNLSLQIISHEWITDDIIHLYFQMIAEKVIDCKDTCFISPSVSQVSKIAEKFEQDLLLRPLLLETQSYIFIPISDAEPVMETAGQHWSLLFFVKCTNTFYYFDSLKQENLQPAKKCFNIFSKYVSSNAVPSFKTVICPQQNNSVDCGVFVLLFTDWLVRGIEEGKVVQRLDNCLNDLKVYEHDIISKRAFLAYISYNSQYKILDNTTVKALILKPAVSDTTCSVKHERFWKTVNSK